MLLFVQHQALWWSDKIFKKQSFSPGVWHHFTQPFGFKWNETGKRMHFAFVIQLNSCNTWIGLLVVPICSCSHFNIFSTTTKNDHFYMRFNLLFLNLIVRIFCFWIYNYYYQSNYKQHCESYSSSAHHHQIIFMCTWGHITLSWQSPKS